MSNPEDNMSPERPGFVIDPNKLAEIEESLGPEGNEEVMEADGNLEIGPDFLPPDVGTDWKDNLYANEQNTKLRIASIDEELTSGPLGNDSVEGADGRDQDSDFKRTFSALRDPRSHDQAARRIQTMITEAKDAGLLDEAHLRVVDIVRNTGFGELASRLNQLAKDLENETDYRGNPDLRGIVEQAIRGAALAYRFNHLHTMTDAQRADLGVTREAYQRLRDAVAREVFWLPRLNNGEMWKPEAVNMPNRPGAQAIPTDQERREQGVADRRYEEYRRQERWNTSKPLNLNPQDLPTFYDRMTQEQKDVFSARLEVAHAAWYKRTHGGSLGNLGSMKPEMGNPIPSITDAEIETLYERMPGFKQGLVAWVEVLNNPFEDRNRIESVDRQGRPTHISVMEVGSKTDADTFRRMIQGRIKETIREQLPNLTEEELDSKALDAEQTVFNFLYFSNVFEVKGRPQWRTENGNKVLDLTHVVNGRREKIPKFAPGLFIQPVVREQLFKLEDYIDNVFTSETKASVISAGPFGPATYELIKQSGISVRDFDRIQIIPATAEANKKNFTIRNRTLYVLEVYVSEYLGSMLDETKIGDQTIYQMLSTGNADNVEWSRAGGGITSSYLSKARQGEKLNEYQNGGHQFSEIAKPASESWKGGIDSIFDKFTALKNEERLRWLIYSSYGVNNDPKVIRKNRAPMLAGGFTQKDYVQTIMRNEKIIRNPFHPWDGVGPPSGLGWLY